MLLLILLMMDRDGNARETLRELLRVYRENRDLLVSLSNVKGAPEESAPSEETQKAQNKSRPEAAGNAAVLEEYLKRFSA